MACRLQTIVNDISCWQCSWASSCILGIHLFQFSSSFLSLILTFLLRISHLRTMVLESVKFLGSTLTWTLRAGCVAHLIHEYVYEFTETRGESMLPTLQSHADYVHVLKKYKLGRNIDIGDCVVATKPSDPDGEGWVTGDSLNHSLDSRSYSVLPMGLIRGKIVAANSMDRGFTSPEGKWWFWNFRKITNSFIEE